MIVIKSGENILNTQVFIDGVEITGVRYIRFEQDVNEVPILELEIIPFKKNIKNTERESRIIND